MRRISHRTRSLLLLFALTFACAGGDANLDPVAPSTVGDLRKMENPPTGEQTWAFVASIDSWSAAYADAQGEVRLRIFAFVFPDVSTAKQTYESSRVSSETGTGVYTKAGEERIGGTRGLHLADAKGEAFQFRRGAWLVVLAGPSSGPFADAVKGIRWERVEVR